jgi:phosphomannomutase
MTIDLDNFKDYGQGILSDLEDFVKESENWEIAPKNYQGLRVNCGGNDWFLLRMSLHDPVLVLNLECDKEQDLEEILDSLREFLTNYNQLKSIL